MAVRAAAALFLSLVAAPAWGAQRGDKCDTDIVFVLDASGTLKDGYGETKKYVLRIANELQIAPGGQRAALINFAGKLKRPGWTELGFGSIRSNAALAAAVQSLRALDGSTYLGEALNVADGMLAGRGQAAKGRPAYVILLSDGKAFYLTRPPVDERAVAVAAARRMRAAGARILAVVLPGYRPDLPALANITGGMDSVIVREPGEPDGGVLRRTLEAVRSGIKCAQIITTSTSTTTTTATTTTTTTTTTTDAGCPIDLLLVMDNSGSVQFTRFIHMDMAERLLRTLPPVGKRGTRVALVTFATKGSAQVIFHFGKHSSMEEVISEMRSVPWRGGLTDPSDGLTLAAKELRPDKAFSRRVGSRPGSALQAALVFTDGHRTWFYRRPTAAAARLRRMNVLVLAAGVDALWPDTAVNSGGVVRVDRETLMDIAGVRSNVYANDARLRGLAARLQAACGQ